MKKGKRQKRHEWDVRFATRALTVIAITTGVFLAAQYISFLITRMEQTVLIQYYFTVVGLECGGMLLKRILEVVVARIKKKEQLDIPDSGNIDSTANLPAETTNYDDIGGVG